MSERYTHLYSLPKNCYVPNAPVLVEAGALLKDNKCGKVIGQLKILNLQDKPIKAAKVAFLPFDTTGKVLGQDFEFQYLDLNAHKNQDFGSQTPVEFPDNTTRAFLPAVMEVVFADNTQWVISPSEVWDPLPKQKTLESTWGDASLRSQYQTDTSNKSTFFPEDCGEIWRCACGAVNPSSNGICRICHIPKTEIFSNLSVTNLKEKIEQRIAEEKHREQSTIEQKKKRNRIFAFCGIAAGVIAIAAVIMVTVVNPAMRYNQAISYMENSQYTEAIAAFKELGSYRDAPMKMSECNTLQEEAERKADYDEALNLMEEGDYHNAIMKFTFLGDYADSVNKKNECYLGEGDAYFANGNYDSAIEKYEEVCSGDFLETAKEHIYNKGVELYNAGDYKTSHSYFISVLNHSLRSESQDAVLYSSLTELLQNDDLSWIVTQLSSEEFADFKPAQDYLNNDVCLQILQLKDYVGVYRSQAYNKDGVDYYDYISISENLRPVTNDFETSTNVDSADDLSNDGYNATRTDTIISVDDYIYTVRTEFSVGGWPYSTNRYEYSCLWTFTITDNILTLLSSESSDADYLSMQTGTYEKIV